MYVIEVTLILACEKRTKWRRERESPHAMASKFVESFPSEPGLIPLSTAYIQYIDVQLCFSTTIGLEPKI